MKVKFVPLRMLLIGLIITVLCFSPAPSFADPVWSIVPSPNPGFSILYSVATITANDVWAAGYFINTAGVAQPLIEHWDGTSWSIVSSPIEMNNALISISAVSANDVWAAVGGSLIEHWDGSAWSIVQSLTVPGNLYSVSAIADNDVWAVGMYLDNTTGAVPLIAHWDGNTWNIGTKPLPIGYNNYYLMSVSAISANDVWAVGRAEIIVNNFSIIGEPLIMHWNGTNWSIISNPSIQPPGQLYSVAGKSANNVWAVGSYTCGGNNPCPLIEHYDGNSWTIVQTPVTATAGVLVGVTVPTATDVWTVGNYYPNNQPAPLIEHWDGNTWSVVPVPHMTGSLQDTLWNIAAVSEDNIWAVGTANLPSVGEQALIEHYVSNEKCEVSDEDRTRLNFPIRELDCPSASCLRREALPGTRSDGPSGLPCLVDETIQDAHGVSFEVWCADFVAPICNHCFGFFRKGSGRTLAGKCWFKGGNTKYY